MDLPDFLHHGRASCTSHDPNLFTTCTPANLRKARAICAGCPLRVDCQTWAVDREEPVGVWGGLSPSERVQLRRGPGWWVDDEGRIRQPCGTVEALGAHRAYGETCTPCEDVERVQVTAQRRVQLAVEHDRVRGGTRRGHELHRLLGEDPCRACVVADRAASASRASKARRAARAAAGPMALAS